LFSTVIFKENKKDDSGAVSRQSGNPDGEIGPVTLRPTVTGGLPFSA